MRPSSAAEAAPEGKSGEPGHRHGCCGGGECCRPTHRGCGLEIIERPQFSCGMALTDGDLTAIVDWAGDHLRLQRLRDGWGVVCGLDVRCDPCGPGILRLEPGYAIDCDGRDLIVDCDGLVIDLTAACLPCNPACPEPDPDQSGEVVIDLYLAAADTPADARLVRACSCRGGSGGGGSSACGCGRSAARATTGRSGAATGRGAAARLRETVTVLPCRVPPGSGDPAVGRSEAWVRDYAGLHRWLDDVGPSIDGDKASVDSWLRSRPETADTPCGWWDRIRADAGDAWREVIRQQLVELVLHQRRRFLGCTCVACLGCGEPGVPIARVALRPTVDRAGAPGCVVSCIDTSRPWRRPLHRAGRPCPPGQVDLGSFIGEQWDYIAAELCRLGITGHASDWSAEPLAVFDQTTELLWSCGAEVEAVTVLTCAGPRVIGFRPPAAERPARRSGTGRRR